MSHRRRVGLFSLGSSSEASESASPPMDFSRSVGALFVLIARSITAACASSLSAACLNDNAAASKALGAHCRGRLVEYLDEALHGGEQTSAELGVERGLPACSKISAWRLAARRAGGASTGRGSAPPPCAAAGRRPARLGPGQPDQPSRFSRDRVRERVAHGDAYPMGSVVPAAEGPRPMRDGQAPSTSAAPAQPRGRGHPRDSPA